MSEILNEEQVAALVDAARNGEEPAPAKVPKARARRVREIDFSRPTKFTQEQQRRLERSHETFCRAASTQLSAELRVPVELEVINVTQQTWGTALEDLPQASIFAVVATEPLGTRLLLSAELVGIVRLIERMLGGQGTAKVVQRELSEIDLVLARRVLAKIGTHLSVTWDELMGITLEVAALESQLAGVQLAPASEPILALTLELRIDGSSSTFTLVVPHRSIEPVVDRLSASRYGDAPGNREADAAIAASVRAALVGVEVELRAEVATVERSIGEVLELRPGDVLRLGTPADAGVTLFADAAAIHRCRPGRSGVRRAVEIVDRLEEL